MKTTWSRRRFVGSALQGVASVGVSRLAAGASSSTGAKSATSAAPAFLPEQRSTLAAAMDEIIPAAQGLPSASQAGCLDYLARAWPEDAGLRVELVKSLEAASESARAAFGREFDRLDSEGRIAALQRLEQSDPAAFRSLRDTVYEAYYTRPEVWKRLGHEFYPPERPGPLPPPFDESLLARVRQMPRLYRVPGG
jgi:hypothetical protein